MVDWMAGVGAEHRCSVTVRSTAALCRCAAPLRGDAAMTESGNQVLES